MSNHHIMLSFELIRSRGVRHAGDCIPMRIGPKIIENGVTGWGVQRGKSHSVKTDELPARSSFH